VIVQRAALRAADERRQLRELVESDESVTSVLSEAQIASCFDVSRLLAHAATLIDRLQQLEDPAHAAR
jgi:adenylosuccinate lyase